MADNDNTKDKSNSSSFEDLSKTAAAELKDAPTDETAPALAANTKLDDDEHNDDNSSPTIETTEDDVIDVIGTGQLLKKTLSKGTCQLQPQRGDICTITYTGMLDDGTVVEQRTYAIVQIGDVEVVQGLDMALPLMVVGERAQVTCDARFAYGSAGVSFDDPTALTAPVTSTTPAGIYRAVPPLARITYDVTLLACEPEPEIAELPFEKRHDVGVAKRERGNFWYSRGDYNLAIQLYRRSLEYLNDNGPGVEVPSETDMTNAQLQQLLEVRIKVYNNLAAAQMKIAAFDTALQSVDTVLRCQPENVKALFRKGKILESKGDAAAAIPVLQKAATLDADSKAIQQLLAKCIMKARRDERQEKDFYRKMMGQAQRADETKRQQSQQQRPQLAQAQLNDSGREVPKLKLWGYLMGSILIGVAGVAMYRYKYF